MTQSEFIKQYCLKSNITEEKLNNLWEFAIPCNCWDVKCSWFAMVNIANLKHHINLYIKK